MLAAPDGDNSWGPPLDRVELCRLRAEEAAGGARRSAHCRADYLIIADGWKNLASYYARDGYRMQIRIRGGKTVFYSRNGLDWTHRFPEIAKACEALDDGVIDGEVCALDKNGLPSANAFGLLTERSPRRKPASSYSSCSTCC